MVNALKFMKMYEKYIQIYKDKLKSMEIHIKRIKNFANPLKIH